MVVGLWNEVRAFFSPSIIFEPLTPKSALLGISNKDDLYLIKNHILLIFKFCIYKNREKLLIYTPFSMPSKILIKKKNLLVTKPRKN